MLVSFLFHGQGGRGGPVERDHVAQFEQRIQRHEEHGHEHRRFSVNPGKIEGGRFLLEPERVLQVIVAPPCEPQQDGA